METSTKSKHTPGPWEVGDDGISTPFVGDRIIVNTGQECAEADARLIAAAPDLLAALHLIADAHHYSGMTYCQYVARDAIAKATVHD